MYKGVHRREFVRQARNHVLGCSFLSFAACSTGAKESAPSKGGIAWVSRIADLEESIPELMEENKVPGLSIAIVRDAKLAWTRGFGVRDRTSKALVDDSTTGQSPPLRMQPSGLQRGGG